MKAALLRGRVQSGERNASHWLQLFNEEYSRKLAMAVYPGSLNLKLEDSFDWLAPTLQPFIVRFNREEYGGERDILLLPSRLLSLAGEPAFLWTTTTALDVPQDVIEIIAAVSLREKYGLSDGDLVTLELTLKGR